MTPPTTRPGRGRGRHAAGTVESHNDQAGTNSQATITLSDCTLNSSKDISYIAFVKDSSQVDKIEGVDSRSFDLAGHDGIEDVDQVRVKAGTTVAAFSVSCGTADTDGDTHDDTKTDEHDDDSKDDDATWDDHDDDAKEDSDDDSGEHTDDDSGDHQAETDEEWDARHDGRQEHKDHQEKS